MAKKKPTQELIDACFTDDACTKMTQLNMQYIKEIKELNEQLTLANRKIVSTEGALEAVEKKCVAIGHANDILMKSHGELMIIKSKWWYKVFLD